MSDITEIDFGSQFFYIGIDVHKKRWIVTIRSNGMELRTFSMNPSPEELTRYLERNYPGGRYCSVYEAGFCGFWIHCRLEELGVRNMVVHAADIPITDKGEETQARQD